MWIKAVEGRRVVGSEEEGVSSLESESWDWDLSLEEGPRAMGLRRGREEKGERRGVEGVDFLMRLECAAVVWKDIVRGGCSRRVKECDVKQRRCGNHGGIKGM